MPTGGRLVGAGVAVAMFDSIEGVTEPSAPDSRFSAGIGRPNTIRPPLPISTPIGCMTACAEPPANVVQLQVGVPVVHQLYNVSCPALCIPPIRMLTGISAILSMSHFIVQAAGGASHFGSSPAVDPSSAAGPLASGTSPGPVSGSDTGGLSGSGGGGLSGSGGGGLSGSGAGGLSGSDGGGVLSGSDGGGLSGSVSLGTSSAGS